jgi:hypothetical protein
MLELLLQYAEHLANLMATTMATQELGTTKATEGWIRGPRTPGRAWLRSWLEIYMGRDEGTVLLACLLATSEGVAELGFGEKVGPEAAGCTSSRAWQRKWP